MAGSLVRGDTIFSGCAHRGSCRASDPWLSPSLRKFTPTNATHQVAFSRVFERWHCGCAPTKLHMRTARMKGTARRLMGRIRNGATNTLEGDVGPAGHFHSWNRLEKS